MMARGLKFRIYEVERLYYICSVNKGADQLSSYRAADIRLCFRKCKKQVFKLHGSYINKKYEMHILYCNAHIWNPTALYGIYRDNYNGF